LLLFNRLYLKTQRRLYPGVAVAEPVLEVLDETCFKALAHLCEHSRLIHVDHAAAAVTRVFPRAIAKKCGFGGPKKNGRSPAI
jgi:hypothetical protein